MNILAIDPGQFKSGWCIIDGDAEKPIRVGYDDNEDILVHLIQDRRLMGADVSFGRIVCEWFRAYMIAGSVGQGESTFHTCRWVGRFQQAFSIDSHFHLIQRPDICRHWTGRTTARKSQVNAALYEFYGTGTCKSVKGTKKNPGPCYGFTAHSWDALAAGVAFLQKRGEA